MADVTLRVKTETRDAKSELERIQQLANALGAKKTTIKFDSKSVDGAAASLRSVKTEAAKIKMDSGVFDAYIKGAISLDKALEGVQQETKKTSSVFSTLTQRFTAANLISTAVTASISRMKQALREAVSEMKEMDKELTTIKMVTGASDYDISKLTEQAFVGARANGRSVNDYLTAAERFARAGYRDNIDQLSKLSLMTQNIGGVEEDTAAKFLLAADAAWKLNGSYDALMGVLDGVSSVADQNATDLSKIAEGITVAGSAFANAGESAQTFTAMLGATTASTQRSGSEMARGLRTILFRVRQVKAEFDDGEIVDDKAISNAAKALSDVGISVLDETGDLKSLSQVLEELSKKWGSLSKAQQSYLQNYLAGNRNGNVLFALMDNWGAYEKMISQYEESSGTALEKNAIYTESWAASTENLKTAWVELVGTMTENGGLLQGFVDNIATPLIDKMSAFTHELQREDGIIWFFKNLGNYEWEAAPDGNFRLRRKDILEEDAKALEKAKKATEESGESAEEASGKIVDYSGALEGAGESADGAADKIEKAATAFDKQRTKISEVAKAIKEEKNTAVDSLADIYKAAMEAADKGYYGSNAYRQGGALFFSEENLNKLREEGKLSAKEYLDAYFEEAESGDYSTAAANFFGKITEGSNEIKAKNGEVLASVQDIGDGYQWTFDKGNRTMEEYLKSLESNTGIAQAFWASMLESLGMYSQELASWEESNGEAKTEAQFEDEKAKAEAQTWIDLLNSIPPFIQTTVRTVYETSGLGAAQQAATPKTYSWSGYGSSTQGARTATDYSGNATSSSGNAGYNWSGYKGKAGGKRDSYSGIALVNDEYPANGSKPELIISPSTGSAYIANGGKPALVNLASDDIVLTSKETKSALGVPGFAIGKTAITVVTPKGSGSKSSGSSGGSSAQTVDPTENWNQLKKLIDYMVEEQKGILDQNLKVLDKQLEELEATRKAQKDEDELTEKQLKVDEALLDLQKAQNERTVRYYNESTHQWEWMADQGVLAQAEEAYSDALKELKDFLSELDFNEQKAAIQAQKDALQEAFDAYKEGWDTIVKSIEKPTGDLAALFEELKVNGTEAMQAQAGNISALLGALETGFFYGIDDVTNAAASGITEVVNRANAFLDSVKKTEDAKAAEEAKAKSSSGGGGSDGGNGSTRGSTGADSDTETGSTSSGGSTLSDAVKGLSTKVSLYTSRAESIIHAIGETLAPSVPSVKGNDLRLDDIGFIKASYKSSNSTVNNSGYNTYINGVKIGSDLATKPLNKVLSALTIHANQAK